MFEMDGIDVTNTLSCSPLLTFADLILFRGRSPCIHFSRLYELWIKLVFVLITLCSLYPYQSGPSSRHLPSYRHRCYF